MLDKAQKEPTVFDMVKVAYDRGEVDFTVMLGSSQILMISRIRESLAGRVFVYELWPLLLCELTRIELNDKHPILDRLITESSTADEIFQAGGKILSPLCCIHSHP